MTRNRAQLFAIVGAVLMIASLVAPAAAGAAVAEEEPGDLTIDVEDNVVTITDDDGPVEGANVTVELVDDGDADTDDGDDADDGDTDADDGDDTDADDGDESDEEDSDEEESYTYEGTGDYVTDEDGTVELPTPEEEVEVVVTAKDGDRTAETTATLTPDDPATNFGQEVSTFVSDLQDEDVSGPMGIQVAQFVLENNPAADNIPDHAGPPEHAGPDGEDDREQGPPADAGPGGDDEDSNQGPPADAGPGGDDADDEEEETEDDDEETDDEDDGDDEEETEDDDDADA